ncbi:MAG: type IV secretion system DNA-binding domain-containing protein [Acidimicrobiia bacterium]|nr:MAG: type IV secretion system DNA-binding domain-containing protein [Acidimicrobiia bacterium]
MITYRISHPGSTDARQIVSTLRSLLATIGRTGRLDPSRRFLCLEVWATAKGITHLLTVPETAPIVSALTTALPGVRVEESERPTEDLAGSSAGIQLLGPTPGVLRTDIADDTATSVLAAMSDLRRGEILVVQWLIAPLIRSRSWLMPSKDAPDRIEKLKRAEAEVVACGRVAAWAATTPRARGLIGTTARALRSVSGPDGHLRARGSVRAVRSLVSIRPPLLVWPSHLNLGELVGLVGWPTDPTPIRGLSRGASRLLPPPAGAPTKGPVVGVTTFPGTGQRIRLGTTGRLRHLHVIGPTGVGKTTLLTHLIAADIKAGRGVVVFDPLGDLTDHVARLVPENRISDVVIVDPTDSDEPVGLNVLSGADRYRTVDFLVGVMARLFASSWGPRTADVLRAGLLTLSAAPTSTLADLPELLTNPAFRRRHLAPVMDDRALAGFWTWYETLSEAERNSVIAPVLNKIRAVVLRPEALRTLCHPAGRLDLEGVFTRRQVVVVRLAKGLIGEDTAALIGGLLLARLWQSILGRASIIPERRHPVFVYLDEFQDYLRLPIGLGDMLAQARGMGVGIVAAHQHLGQLPDNVRRDVLSNTGSRVMFQTTADDARILARDLEPHLTAADLRGLASREIAVRIALTDRMLPPFTGRTLPPLKQVTDPRTVRSRSREQFGAPLPRTDVRGSGQDESRIGRKRRRGDR